MSRFKRKKGSYKMLSDHYVPAALPTCGESLENYVASEYAVTDPSVIKKIYDDAKMAFQRVINTCDHHCAGTECDHYVDNAIGHLQGSLQAEIADHKNQITRIRSAMKMRKAALTQRITSLTERMAQLKTEIELLENLRAQFQLHIGNHAISLGLPITILAMIVDAAVNYNFLESILLSDRYLLWITVICMSIMSDFSMWALGTFISHRAENFTHRVLYRGICVMLLGMFILSVIASVAIRFGSMDATFGTVNAAGEYVGKTSYSLAEYGVTLVTAFLTTATGILSFAFSLDKNAFAVSVRERKRKELMKYQEELEPLEKELALLENAPDPQERDDDKLVSARQQIETTRTGLKLLCRKMMSENIQEPGFTEKMAVSGEQLVNVQPSIPLLKGE